MVTQDVYQRIASLYATPPATDFHAGETPLLVALVAVLWCCFMRCILRRDSSAAFLRAWATRSALAAWLLAGLLLAWTLACLEGDSGRGGAAGGGRCDCFTALDNLLVGSHGPAPFFIVVEPKAKKRLTGEEDVAVGIDEDGLLWLLSALGAIFVDDDANGLDGLRLLDFFGSPLAPAEPMRLFLPIRPADRDERDLDLREESNDGRVPVLMPALCREMVVLAGAGAGATAVGLAVDGAGLAVGAFSLTTEPVSSLLTFLVALDVDASAAIVIASVSLRLV